MGLEHIWQDDENENDQEQNDDFMRKSKLIDHLDLEMSNMWKGPNNNK